MLNLHQIALYLHIAVGSCALLIFWIPVFTRKGNLNHKRFGRYFTSAMYIVSLSGILMGSLDLLFPLAMHAPDLEIAPDQVDNIQAQVRNFAIFLFSLSILVLASARQGWLSMVYKADRSGLRTPLHTGLCLSLLTIGLVLFSVGLLTGNVLFIIFSIIQVFTGLDCLRYNFKKNLNPKEWWTEHLKGVIGAGIGAYTAFAVFGGRRIFDDLFGDSFANMSIILWLAPGVVGAIAISYLSRHYSQRFNGRLALKSASGGNKLIN